MLKRLLLLLTLFVLAGQVLYAQVTTSSISGIVSSGASERLTGATITAVHIPTGSTYTTTSRTNGQYQISNMQPGGPYRITTSFVGFAADTKENIFLALGEDQKIDVDLRNSSTELTTVVVSGSRTATRTGSETTISRERLENLPTVGRNIQDYMRAVPQMKTSNAGGGASSEGAMSFAGQNVRNNSFYIDGAVNNDVFGLAYSGTNGGQSNISPISIDAIEQFQVSISPFNASLGNFTGAAINAITKSGTNNVHGSAYYLFRNEKLSGKTPTGPKDQATRIPDFTSRTYGFTLGGAIIKNKLFYFVSGELQREQSPSFFSLGTYQGLTKDPARIELLKQTIAARANGFDVGGYENLVAEINSDKIATKIDWNINTANKFTLSYRYTYGDKIQPLTNDQRTLRFETNGFTFPSKTHSASAELRTNFKNNSNNRLLLTVTDVEDDRGGIGQIMPLTTINDGSTQNTIVFGTDNSSTFNYLKQTTLNLVNHYRFNVGRHNFMTGIEGEYYSAFNTFIQNTVGNYRYLSLQDFLDNKAPDSYSVNYPTMGTDEKSTGSASDFNVFKGAAFINDEINFGKNFRLSLGVRADYYKFLTDPAADPYAINTALPAFSRYYDLKGAMPGVEPSVPLSISPRLGFTYQIPSENITIRGGLGLFTGRIPLVWPSAIYNSNGISQGGYSISTQQNPTLISKVQWRPTAYTPQELTIPPSNSKGTLLLSDDKFKMPKVFRTSLAMDKRFGTGWSTTLEAMFTKTINDVYYTNINILPPTLRMASGPDTRNVYPSPITIPINADGSNPYSNAFLITNYENEEDPYSYNLTASINKSTRDGFNFYLSYNYGESYVINEAQSSTPGSQWNSMETVNGRNFLGRTVSDNSAGHRIFAFTSKKFTYLNKKLSTTVSLVYNGESGQVFSYVYAGSNNGVRDGQTNNDLIYVPTAADIQSMNFITTTTVTADAATQRAALEQYIQNDKYLSSRRGEYAERNGSRAPFSNVVDLRIAQGFNINIGGKSYSAEIIYNMFNFTNFLNREWGHRYFVPFDNFGLLTQTYASATNLTPRYTFNPATSDPAIVYNRVNPTYTARWLSQLEFRVRF
jgi:hypothetical protein